MLPGDFLAVTVVPALIERLDQAFPEFGWRRDSEGWIASNDQYTQSRFGVAARRVVAHGLPPNGFFIHGEGSVLWTQYVNGGAFPTGDDFKRAVRTLAERAGVDTAVLDRAQPRDRRADLLQAFFDHCRRELASDRGAHARAYLERRGFPGDTIHDTGLGLVPRDTRRVLEQAGFGDAEIEASGVLADSRWPGRLCGAWRDEYGRIGTLWARTLEDTQSAGSRYLYLPGASRTNLPPYGLSQAFVGGCAEREIVLVEGLLDVHQLRTRGIENVAALGGTALRPQTFERLHRRAIETVTLCLDNDEAGRVATARAVEQAARAERSPDVYAVDPRHLAPAKDPDELVRSRGAGAMRDVLGKRACGIEWRAHELAAGVTRESSPQERRAALARAGRWLGTLPPRLAVEQEQAVLVIADRCGYSSEAVARSFRARYWNPPQRERRHGSRAAGKVLER